MVARYVTQAAFDTYVANELGHVESDLRMAALVAAERVVDEYCQRSFAVAGTASARLYVPTGSSILRIHDCTTVTAVTVDGATVASSDYQKEPTAVSWTGRTKPYEQLRHLSSYWWGATAGEASVSVTATWGWSAIPDEVPEAVKILGKELLQQRRTVGNMAASGDFGGYVRQNTYIRTLLDPLRRVEAWGIA